MPKEEVKHNMKNLKRQLPQGNRLYTFRKWTPDMPDHEYNERYDEKIESEVKRQKQFFYMQNRHNNPHLKHEKKVPKLNEQTRADPTVAGMSKNQYHNQGLMLRFQDNDFIKPESKYEKSKANTKNRKFLFQSNDQRKKERNEWENLKHVKTRGMGMPKNNDRGSRFNAINSRYQDKADFNNERLRGEKRRHHNIQLKG